MYRGRLVDIVDGPTANRIVGLLMATGRRGDIDADGDRNMTADGSPAPARGW
jgi:hypothetical protein